MIPWNQRFKIKQKKGEKVVSEETEVKYGVSNLFPSKTKHKIYETRV